MFFEIENTPEYIRKARRKDVVKKQSPKEECPRLVLAPFARPPQVVFDNVFLGCSCERELEIINPSKQVQQITLCRALPPGLVIHLPGEWLVLKPETCYCLTMSWTPMQPTALRETIRFTDESRGRYDVIIVLKSAMNVKGKSNQPKSFKTSPGKIKKKSHKRSPVAIYKKKAEVIYNTTNIKKSVCVNQYTDYRVFKTSNKENISTFNDFSLESQPNKCPFDSPSSIDLHFDTSEIFANMRRPNFENNIMQNTYDKSFNSNVQQNVPTSNILKPSNMQNCSSSDIFDNLTFTPLKALPGKSEKLDKGPKIILSMNSDSELDDSLNVKTGNENETHSIICIASTQQNNWLTVNHQQFDSQCIETPALPNKKIPNTSSPKELNSPNFSINTDFSRISDLSFLPQRFSTERKMPKINNDTHEILDDLNTKFSSDTYTKESPNTPVELNQMYAESRPPHFLIRDNRMCRQALFKEHQQQREAYDRNYLNPYELNVWQNVIHTDLKSSPRSMSPPLQSIPEESNQLSDTQTLDKTERHRDTFVINRTFDKISDRNSISANSKTTWSKKSVRAEPELWKVPVPLPRKSLKPKASIASKDSLCGKESSTFDCNKSANQNISLNQVGNVYSQSSTVDPFLSASYFYDEEAVHKLEQEFKRWLNCVLTPPADLDSNVEQKVDVGKAWIENRNKEVPAAPTKEQVCSVYHNSHRLDSLRRAAKALLMSPEIVQVFQKLNAQIEKKLIAIRTDRNLHLDVGLQKIIMELLLCYNPLWLRIGLEAIYGLVLPLKSNSDIEGLTTFIIQRMFKNPHLKNKHSKSSAPNMLLPAYMEAIKKFTLKKFFMLVFFLDQAKQRRLITHDPCLFCRNAICKESREIVIRFTKEVIAGIGDITKHLRPLGYVICHKQSFLDEYKYAVHNIALDIRDGVRLTKVMEIILMKNGLLNQLRTPPISRLQKIHNVQVAINALKEANFVIDGDITAYDIADGHREKTLSLLWQLIHVFRAPLFEKAANVIQTWWRKKYEVIVEKMKEEEKLRQKQSNAASVIQFWWRRIQYNRLVEGQKEQFTVATVILQKYCRMWLCRTRLLRLKTSVLKIEDWYRSMKMTRAAKETLRELKLQREALRRKSAVVIQSHIRRWLCVKRYNKTVKKVVLIQSLIRRHLARKWYMQLRKSVIYIQQKYRSNLLMKKYVKELTIMKKSAIVIQSFYRMVKQRRFFRKLNRSVQTVEDKYIALLRMRREVEKYKKLKRTVVLVQARYRGKKCRLEFLRKRNSIVKIQRKVRAHLLMKKERAYFLQLKNATVILQNRVRAHLAMKKARQDYIVQHKSAILIQRYFRSYLLAKLQRHSYIRLRNATVVIQKHYRSLLAMRQQRSTFLTQKNTAIVIQRWYRAQVLMKVSKNKYDTVRAAVIAVQRRFRANMKMREQRASYLKLKSACVTIQNAYRAYVLGKWERQRYLEKKMSVNKIKSWFKNCKKTKEVKQQFQQSKQACTTIQRTYRAYIIGRKQRQEYIRIKTSTICIQKYYRAYIEMKTVRTQYIQLKAATATIQRFYRSYLETKQLRYARMLKACSTIQGFYRAYIAGKKQREEYLKLKTAAVVLQTRYRALLAMRNDRKSYLRTIAAAITIQRRFRAHRLMLEQRFKYQQIVKASVTIQRFFRAYIAGKKQRMDYVNKKTSATVIQQWFRNITETRKIRRQYLLYRKTVVIIQLRFRAKVIARKIRHCESATKIQMWYRSVQKRNECRNRYLKVKRNVVVIQSILRMHILRKRFQEMKNAASTIQRYYRSYRQTVSERQRYLQLRTSVITLQSYVRRFIERKRYLRIRSAVVTIQAVYRWKRELNLVKQRRDSAAVCIQKNFRRYLAQSKYQQYRKQVTFIQKLWRGKLFTRLMRCDFMQKRRIVVKLQAVMRGYLVRKQVQLKKEEFMRKREEQRRHWAASKIQALFRGHKTRLAVSHDRRITMIRRRWREGALESVGRTLKERHEEALEVFRNLLDIENVITAFRSLELLTEVMPMMYESIAPSIVRRVYIYISVTNRSISSVEVLKSAAALLVNLTRYRLTGPKIYARDNIPKTLKYMLRFSNSETHLVCILATYLWLFSKYDGIREDLTEFLHTPEHHKMLLNIKGNVNRIVRMASKTRNKPPQPSKFASHTGNQTLNYSICSSSSRNSLTLPALEPDYGITRADRPRYFEDPQQAITCLFQTYDL